MLRAKRKVGMVLLAMLLIGFIGLIVIHTGTAKAEEIRLASMDDYFGGGDGSTSNPYLIYNATQLRAMSHTINYSGITQRYEIKSHFKLMDNIDLGDTLWTTLNAAYTGSFDGNGKTIRNFKMHVVQSDIKIAYGLFKEIASGGKVFNLTISDLAIINVHDSGSYSGTFMEIGAIAGRNLGVIENCTVNGSIEVDFYGAYIGLIAGANWSGTIRECTSRGKITGTGILGGIVGVSSGSLGENVYNIVFCDNYADIIYSYDTQSGCAAGIVGKNYGNSKIDRCKNVGTIAYSGQYQWNTSIRPCMAQIVGWLLDGKLAGCVCGGQCSFKHMTIGQKTYCSDDEVGRSDV